MFHVSRADSTLVPEFKLWLSNAHSQGIFGDGKWRLLAAIQKTGSLKAAAASLGMSYRKAWGDLKKAEEQLGVALIEKHHGGRTGGGTHLTDVGKTWQQGYAQFRHAMEKEANRAYRKYIKVLE